MVFLFAAQVEEILRRFTGKLRFFFQFTKRRVGEMFTAFQDTAR